MPKKLCLSYACFPFIAFDKGDLLFDPRLYSQTGGIMRFKYVLLATLLMSAFLASNAYSRQVDSEQCLPPFTDVRHVLLTYDGAVPDKNINWQNVMKMSRDSGLTILDKGNIDIQIVQPSASYAELPEDTLYVKVFYSYADKKSFSFPLENDQLASWVEYTRRTKLQSGEFKSQTLKTDLEVHDVKTLDGNSQGSGEEAFLQISSLKNIQKVLCAVLANSANKICSRDTPFPFVNIVPAEKACKKAF